MGNNADGSDNKRPLLKRVLIALFVFALIMGPGPGLFLVNSYAANGGTILGLPALYAWAVFWFAVEAGVVLTAYCTIWRNDTE